MSKLSCICAFYGLLIKLANLGHQFTFLLDGCQFVQFIDVTKTFRKGKLW